MLKFCEKCRGAISVFLTLILIPTFIFGGVLVDGSRILGAKNLISGAGDLAMNAALSGYHEELNQTYGLLAMAKTAEEVEDIMKDFFQATLNASGVAPEDFSKALIYLELTNDDFCASNIPGTEIYRTEVMKQEILEYMKYRAPATLVNRAVTDKLSNLENMEKEKNAADGQIKFESELDDLQELFVQIKELTDRQEEIYVGIKDEEQLNAMLGVSKESYERIAMLAVVYSRITNCSEEEYGDVKSLMEQMVGASCDVSTIDADVASKIIKMKKIKNGMVGKNPNEVLGGLDKDSDEYKEIQQLISDYEQACEVYDEGINKIKEQLDNLVKVTYEEMNGQRKLAVEGEENCKKIIDKLQKLKEKFEKLKDEYERWNTAVAELPVGDSKTKYGENIGEFSGFFEPQGMVAAFEEKVNKNKKFYNEVWTQLDKVTFVDLKVDKDINKKEKFMAKVNCGSINTPEEIKTASNNFFGSYNSIECMGLSVINEDLSQDEFVNKLKYEYCVDANGNECKADADAESVPEADAWDSKLGKSLEDLEKLLLSNDIVQQNISSLSQGELPSVWLGISEYNGAVEESQVNIQGGLKNKNNRKKVANSGSENLNKDNVSLAEMSNLAQKVPKVDETGVGETVVESLLLTEYVMGMFSHYVSHKDTDGNDIEPESLSRHKLSDDALYRAEIEYILWGDPDTRDNVGMTKAIIFTANLVFNMSFAFTNPQIREDAMNISNLFPVGPLARTAIKCALQSMVAMIETTKNMTALMDGKAVPLLKNGAVWETKIMQEPKGDGSVVDFTYEDYLWILVCMKMFNSSQQIELLARTTDCIELNITGSKSNADNTLKDMYTMIDVEAAVSIDTFFLQKLNGAGYNVQAVDDETFKISYYGVQGY